MSRLPATLALVVCLPILVGAAPSSPSETAASAPSAPSAAPAAPLGTVEIGDRGTHRVRVENVSIHPTRWMLGGPGGRASGIDGLLDGHHTATLDLQCTPGTTQAPAPALELRVERRRTPVEAPPLSFPDGAPVVWIVGDDAPPSGVATLLARQGPVIRIPPRALPEHFGALRFASHLVLGSADAAQLGAAQWRAVADAANAGAVVLVALGDDARADGPWVAATGASAGEPVSPGPGLVVEAPRAVRVRPLVFRAGDLRPLVELDGHVLLAERVTGLGRWRVLGLPTDDLAPGSLLDAALATVPGGPVALLAEQARSATTLPPNRLPFGPWPFVALALIVPVAVSARRLGTRGLFAVAALWCVGAAAVPVAGPALEPQGATTWIVDGGAPSGRSVSLWQTEWDHGVGETVAAVLPPGDWSLESSSPGGGCLVRVGEGSWIVLRGEPGSRTRVVLWQTSESTAWTPSAAAPAQDDGAVAYAHPLGGLNVRGHRVESPQP